MWSRNGLGIMSGSHLIGMAAVEKLLRLGIGSSKLGIMHGDCTLWTEQAAQLTRLTLEAE